MSKQDCIYTNFVTLITDDTGLSAMIDANLFPTNNMFISIMEYITETTQCHTDDKVEQLAYNIFPNTTVPIKLIRI